MDELEALRRELAAERQANATLRGQLTQLVEQLARLNERVVELLAVAQRKQRKARAPVPAPPPTPPVVDGQQQRAFDERPRPPEKPKAERTAKKKAKPTGRNRSPNTSRLKSTSCVPSRALGAEAMRLMSPTCSTKKSSTS